MRHVVFATRNRHKFRELKVLLAVPGVHWRSLAEFPQVPPLKETGRTFDANAVQKAHAAARATGLWAIADDSGLEVDGLGKAPGVRSARFAGRHGDDHANNTKLLRLLAGHPAAARRAQYRCSLALSDGSRILALTRGSWRGRIADRPRGRGGFGYDPIFLVPGLGKTVGELRARTKQRLSHRAAAARRMRVVLRKLVVRPHTNFGAPSVAEQVGVGVSACDPTGSGRNQPGRAPAA
jgi:XTP/dITP diphosphohydrolase